MSITFYIAEFNSEYDRVERAYRCDCDDRYSDAWNIAELNDLPYPEVGDYTCDDCTDVSINLGNSNAYDLMRWLDIRADEYGDIPARELAAKCQRRLWDVDRNHDPEVEGWEQGGEGKARVISCGRRPGYLRDTTERLLKVAQKAGERLIAWC